MSDLIIHLRGGCIEGIENNTNTTLKIKIVDWDDYQNEGTGSFIESRGEDVYLPSMNAIAKMP